MLPQVGFILMAYLGQHITLERPFSRILGTLLSQDRNRGRAQMSQQVLFIRLIFRAVGPDFFIICKPAVAL